MKILISILALLIVAPAHSEVDPFGSGVAKWQTEVSAQKPYQIEFAFAELPGDLPHSTDGNREVTEAFLKAARKVFVAISSADLGKIEREDGTVIFYRTKEENGHIQVSFSVTTRLSGVIEMSSDITLPLNKWVAWGGLTSTKVTKADHGDISAISYYTLAIRIIKGA